MKAKNLFLTGPPGVGKTTVVMELVKLIKREKQGFYTQELRQHGRRTGFELVSLDGTRAILATANLRSPFMVGHYGVNISGIEEVAVPAIIPNDPQRLIVVDEIGKMECCSEKFRHTIAEVLSSPNIVIASIPKGGTPFIRSLKKRRDVLLFEVSRKNLLLHNLSPHSKKVVFENPPVKQPLACLT